MALETSLWLSMRSSGGKIGSVSRLSMTRDDS